MKALTLKNGTITYQTVPKPRLKKGEVLIRVKATGICGTDLHIYRGGRQVHTDIIGHEFSGVIEAVSPGVKHVKVGNHVVGEHVLSCKQCRFCRDGQPTLCPDTVSIGHHRPGAFAEYIALPAELAFRIPRSVSFTAAAMIEPLTIALYAVRQVSDDLIGKKVAVIGQGPIGLLLDQVLKLGGAEVTGIDIQDFRLNFAAEHGWVDHTINPKKEKVFQRTHQLAQHGFDMIFEAVGNQASAQLSIDLARPDADIYLLGVFEEKSTIDLMQVVEKELNIYGSWRCAYSFPDAIKLVAKNKIDVASLVTHEYDAADGAQALADAAKYKGQRVKTVIQW